MDEMNRLEADFLALCDWRLQVSPEELEQARRHCGV